jgi:hypothetical protein
MEDFLSQEPFAGRAAVLIEDHLAANAAIADTAVWQQAAEDCVMMRIQSLRLIDGLPLHKAPLAEEVRIRRLKDLLRLWANGCTCAVDEDLFADLLKRKRS